MLQVTDLPANPKEIIDFLKCGVAIKEVVKKLIFQRIIEKSAKEHGITVSPEEIQVESEEFRLKNRLETAALTIAWLQDELISADEWEKGIEHRLLARKLADHLFGQEAEKYFVQNKIDFDLVSLYKVTLPSQAVAYEVLYQIEEGESSFFEAAYRHDTLEENRLNCGYQGKTSRWDLPPELTSHIFGASPGEIVGPLETADFYSIFMVEKFIPATFDATIREEIVAKLFNEWLEREFGYEFQGSNLSLIR